MSEIAKEYAQALFILAAETGEERAYMTALETVEATFSKEAEYMEFLSSPGISLCDRIATLDAVFAEVCPEYVISFIKLLCEKGRIRSFADCAAEYRRLLEVKESLATAKVTSALPLTEEEKAALKQKLEKISKNTVELELAVDPAILGGVIVEIGGKVMDGSLRTRLAGIKRGITQ